MNSQGGSRFLKIILTVFYFICETNVKYWQWQMKLKDERNFSRPISVLRLYFQNHSPYHISNRGHSKYKVLLTIMMMGQSFLFIYNVDFCVKKKIPEDGKMASDFTVCHFSELSWSRQSCLKALRISFQFRIALDRQEAKKLLKLKTSGPRKHKV